MLCLNTSKWSQTLWRSHLTHSQQARTLIAAGIRKQDAFGGLADDLHGLLYLRSTPDRLPDAPQWATDLLQQAQDLAEWKPLRSRCMQSGFAAGVCAETFLRALVPLVPTQAPAKHNDPDQGEAPDPGSTRRALRHAMREAGRAVDQAEGTLEGLTTACGIQAGTGAGAGENLASLAHVRALWSQLQGNPLLQQIAQMAGRLQRLVASQQRATATGRVGAITGITRGGDLDRLLPSELVGLRSAPGTAPRVARLRQLLTLATIQAKRALQYEMRSAQPEARGPILLCLDESSSMQGQPLLLSKAVALTLLTRCREQQRAWGLIGFDWVVQRSLVVEPTAAIPLEDILQVLLGFGGGGTDFTLPLNHALQLLTERPVMQKADVVFVTDGQGGVAAGTIDAINALRQAEGLRVFVVGIGPHADLTSLAPIATQSFHLSRRPSEGETVPLLMAVA